MAVAVGVRAVDSEVDGLAPHPSRAETHVKALFSSVDKVWASATSPMEKHSDLRVLSMLDPQLFLFVLELLPQLSVLYPLDLLNSGLRHGKLEPGLKVLPLDRASLHILDGDLLIAENKIVSVLPSLWEIELIGHIEPLLDFEACIARVKADDLNSISFSPEIRNAAELSVLGLESLLELVEKIVCQYCWISNFNPGFVAIRVFGKGLETCFKSIDVVLLAGHTEPTSSLLMSATSVTFALLVGTSPGPLVFNDLGFSL